MCVFRQVHGRRVVSVLGVKDGIKTVWDKPGAGVCGAPWARVFAVTGTTASDIWPEELPHELKTLWTAGVQLPPPPTAVLCLASLLWK